MGKLGKLKTENDQSLSETKKNNEGKNITKQDALYLIQDAKQQILKSHLDIRILHIIVENYVYDNVKYKFLPLEKNCKKFSIDVKFICFPKNLLKNFEQLFLKQQIFINQYLLIIKISFFQIIICFHQIIYIRPKFFNTF